MSSTSDTDPPVSQQIAPDRIDPDIVARGAVIKRTDFNAAIRHNKNLTVILCIILLLISAVMGYAIGFGLEVSFVAQDYAHVRNMALSFSTYGVYGAGIVSSIGLIVSLIAATKGDSVVLTMSGAKEIDHNQEPVLHNVVEEMAISAGLPKPKVYVLNSDALNAFAAGLRPEKSSIAVTRGLLDACNRDQLQGVVAHEMAHVLNNDVLYATVIGVMVGWIVLVADGAGRSTRNVGVGGGGSKKNSGGGLILIIILVLVAILAPLSARLVQMTISRQREYLADATAVKLTRNPHGLIGALKKIANTRERFADANRGTQHIFIANPFRDFDKRASSLMSTHPPLADRIARLSDLR